MKYIYAIVVQPIYGLPVLSLEAYETLEQAQKFIENRIIAPAKASDFKYETATHTYYIQCLTVRSE